MELQTIMKMNRKTIMKMNPKTRNPESRAEYTLPYTHFNVPSVKQNCSDMMEKGNLSTFVVIFTVMSSSFSAKLIIMAQVIDSCQIDYDVMERFSYFC